MMRITFTPEPEPEPSGRFVMSAWTLILIALAGTWAGFFWLTLWIWRQL